MKTTIKTVSLVLMLMSGATASAQQLRGYDQANMNLDLKPGDNFAEYACGNWLKAAFDKRAALLADYFSTIEVVNGKKVNGRLFVPKKKRVKIW